MIPQLTICLCLMIAPGAFCAAIEPAHRSENPHKWQHIQKEDIYSNFNGVRNIEGTNDNSNLSPQEKIRETSNFGAKSRVKRRIRFPRRRGGPIVGSGIRHYRGCGIRQTVSSALLSVILVKWLLKYKTT